MYEFLKQKGGEFKIYARGFDNMFKKVDKDIEVDYVPRLDRIEKTIRINSTLKTEKKQLQNSLNKHPSSTF